MITSEELADRLIATCLVSRNELIPCSLDDIAQVERANAVQLPVAYRTFLILCGRGAGGFMDDLDVFFPGILDATKWFHKTFGDIVQLPPNAFVFMECLAQEAMYFVCDGTPDPQIMHFREDRDKPTLAYRSIWEFLEKSLILFDEFARMEPGGT
jgi:hypothetical protein